jgi:hypothetical protein
MTGVLPRDAIAVGGFSLGFAIKLAVVAVIEETES